MCNIFIKIHFKVSWFFVKNVTHLCIYYMWTRPIYIYFIFISRFIYVSCIYAHDPSMYTLSMPTSHLCILYLCPRPIHVSFIYANVPSMYTLSMPTSHLCILYLCPRPIYVSCIHAHDPSINILYVNTTHLCIFYIFISRSSICILSVVEVDLFESLRSFISI